MVKVESADVVSGDIDSRQGARDLGHNPTLIEAQGLSPDAHHPPQLPGRTGQQEVTGELFLGLCVHDNGDVTLNEGEGEEWNGS